MKQHIRTLLIAAGLCTAAGVLNAQPSAHYVPGVEGIKAASLPGPGMYVRDYNYYYMASYLADSAGKANIAADPNAHIYANVPRFIWITETKVLGGNLGFDVLVPIISKSLHMTMPGGRFNGSTIGIGDPCVEATLSWHGENYDTAVGYAIWLPIGSFDKEDMSKAGENYWAHMITVGATWYPDSEKKWAASVLTRYEMNQGNHDVDVKKGLVLTFEGGVSRALSKTVDVGLIGYWQQQLSADRGPKGAPPLATEENDKSIAVGLEVSVFHPSIGLGWSLRALQELDCRNRLEGKAIILTVTKPL